MQLLEKALRSNPASLGAERWDRVADMVGSRTKEECVARFKVGVVIDLWYIYINDVIVTNFRN